MTFIKETVMTKARFKSSFKRNKAAIALNKAIEGEGQPKERLSKPQEMAAGYQSRTDRATGTIVVSKKEEPWSYNGVDI